MTGSKKEDAMAKFSQAFDGFIIEFIDEDSTAIRIRAFFDNQGINSIILPTVPRSGYNTPESIDRSIKEIRTIFDEEYSQFLKS